MAALFYEPRALLSFCTTSLTVNDQFFPVVVFNALNKVFLTLSLSINILECDLQSPPVIIRESKTVLHSGFYAMDSGLQVLDFGFQSLVGFRIP